MSLINTRLLAFRAKSDIDKWETRANRWGALDAFMNDTEMPGGIVSPELIAKALAAVGSSLEIPVINYDAGVTIQNVTQPVVITGSPSTSALYAVTFVQYNWGFLIHPAQHFNNEISMQREFEEQMTKHIYAWMDDLDQACLTALENAKTQVLADDLGGRYSLVSDTVEAPQAERDSVIGDFNVLQSGNKFYGQQRVITNGSMESHVRNNLLEQGQFNQRDKTYQYNDKIWHFTNNLANGTGDYATAYTTNIGSLGLIQQFGPDNLMRNRTSKHEWDIERLPIANMNIGTYFYDDAVDGSSLGGAATAHLTATKAEAYGFHTAVAFLTPYISTPASIASAIMKVAIKTT